MRLVRMLAVEGFFVVVLERGSLFVETDLESDKNVTLLVHFSCVSQNCAPREHRFVNYFLHVTH